MKTKELLSVLEKNQGKALLFEYAPNLLVGANYHITEVKHMKIDSVDCGGRTDAWNETIIQLWESPKELGKRDFMKVEKAMEILNLVGAIKPYDIESEVKIEYSNAAFNTAQLYIQDVEIKNVSITFKLNIEKTQCKANDICGIPKTEGKVLETQSSSCDPESNCC
jgi:hypothetical protein